MRRITQWDRNKTARREAIVAAARQIIREGHIDDLSMRKLALRADVSVRTIYNLVGNQNDVLAAVVGVLNDAIRGALASVPDDSPLERLHRIVCAPVMLIMSEPDLFKPALRVSESTPGYDSHDLFESRSVAVLKAEIERAMRLGLLTRRISPSRLALHIYETCDRSTSQWSKGLIDDHEYWRRVMTALYLGLAAVSNNAIRKKLLEKSLQPLKRLPVAGNGSARRKRRPGTG